MSLDQPSYGIISPETISLNHVRAFLTEKETLSLSDESKRRILKARKVVEDIVASGVNTYGVNTGFGKFSDTAIAVDQIDELQRRLVISHATGTGDAIPVDIVRIMMYLKVHSLAIGHSGCTLEAVQLLVDMINKGVTPFVPQKGSVGASGDLAPLAHMALPMIGEGSCFYKGEFRDSKEAFEEA